MLSYTSAEVELVAAALQWSILTLCM